MLKIHLSKILGERRMSQRELSQISKVPRNSINAYYNETAKSINLDFIDKICNALKIKIEDLIEYIPDTPDKKAGE